MYENQLQVDQHRNIRAERKRKTLSYWKTQNKSSQAWVWQRILRYDTKSKATEKKMGKVDFIKLKTFVFQIISL